MACSAWVVRTLTASTLGAIGRLAAIATLALALAACGSASTTTSRSRTIGRTPPARAALPRARPHVVEPAAGNVGAPSRPGSQIPVVTQSAHDPVPTAAATDTAAPAKGAPTDAEVRAAVARFHAAVRRYHLDRLNLAYALLNLASLPPGQYRVSIASVFTDYNKPIACGGVLKVPELGVANKTLPCGTEVIFIYGRRAIRVPVIDRGPYIPGREWDLTGAAAEALHFPGLGPIEWRLG